MNTLTWLEQNWLKVLAIGMVLGALFSVPYFAYYQLMNWVVVGAAVVTAWQALRQGSEWLMWVFIVVAVVFNPLAPLYFRADVWQIADIVAALLFTASFFLIRTRKS